MLSKNIIDKLSTLETPFYLYDMELLRNTLKSVVDESSRYGYKVHYALKANFDSHITECIREHGLGADCVSGNEVRFAIESGFDANQVVFAGVGKSDKEIRYGIEHNIFAFNCESRHELQVINQIASSMGRTANVALRINPDVDPMTHKYISTGQADSKFGISYQEIELVVEELGSLSNINIVGLHFHIGSQILQMQVFEYLCRRVNTLCKWFAEQGFRFSHINLGGGLGINYEQPESELIPNFEQYFTIFHKYLDINPELEIHFELGRSIVAQCGELISRVLYNKTTASGRNVAIIDASMTELIRPALYHSHHAIENISNTDSTSSQIYMVAGTVCESSDIFSKEIQLPQLHRGNLVSIKSAGAYGSAMASNYNLHDLPRAEYSDKL